MKVDANTNESYMADLESAAQLILNHKVFKDIKTLDPLPITDDLSKTSGVQSVFDQGQCKVALAREKKYICSGNFWWHNLLASATPGVPLRKDRVLELGRHMFNVDGDADAACGADRPLPHLPGMLTVLVESPDVDVLSHKGALLRVSPEEIAHAAVFICAGEIMANKPEERLLRWKAIFLSCCFAFEVGEPGHDACYWRAYNLRQAIVATYGGCKRSAKQMAHEVDCSQEAQGVGDWNNSQSQGSGAAQCDHVNTAWICSQPALTRCTDCLEVRFRLSSCLNSMTSLATIIGHHTHR